MSDVASIHRTQVNLSGLMDVLGKNLYSTPTVAIRELVQNAHDSCERRALEEQIDADAPEQPIGVWVSADATAGVLTITDRGAGLTKEEIETYLATVGSGYTRKLRESGDTNLIGQFGLGFLSAYVVAERIELHTTSFQQPQAGWHFSSADGQRYTLASASPRAVGTEIRLTLKRDFYQLLDSSILQTLLEYYCVLLPRPVHLGLPDDPSALRINAAPPPWRLSEEDKAHGVTALRQQKEHLAFAVRFEPTFAPIATLPLKRSAQCPADGLLWIQDGATYASSDNRNVSVFVRGMLVSSDERDLVPRWAGFIGGVIESERMVPTASREALQKDHTYQQIQHAVHRALVDGLIRLAREDAAAWRRTLLRHNEALLGAAISDSALFELLAKELRLPTNQGPMTVPQILKRAEKAKDNLGPDDRVGIFLSLGEDGTESLLFESLGVPVVQGHRFAALPFCERYADHFSVPLRRLSGGTPDEHILVPVDLAEEPLQTLQALFVSDERFANIHLHPVRFAPAHLPAILVGDTEALLKKRIDADREDKRLSQAILSMAKLYTNTIAEGPATRLYLNMDCPLVQRLLGAAPAQQTSLAQVILSMAHLAASRSAADNPDILPLGTSLEIFHSALLAITDDPQSGKAK